MVRRDCLTRCRPSDSVLKYKMDIDFFFRGGDVCVNGFDFGELVSILSDVF